ncbi:MAG: ubiquinone anaerobic biosynthesis accessory factor UbiT [Acidiferrobacteraceae bacterium]
MRRRFLLRPLRLIPEVVHAHVVATALNAPITSASARARVAELEGTHVGIRVIDAAFTVRLTVSGGRFRPDPGDRSDAMICGRLTDLVRLLIATDDADALFFNRRLTLEGDVAAALHVRNVLDAIGYDWKDWIERLAGPRTAEAAAAAVRISRLDVLATRVLSALDHE